MLVEALEVSYQIKEMSIKEIKQVITREGGSLVGVTERFDLMEKYITAVIRSLAREIPSIRPRIDGMKVQLEDKGFPSEFEDEPQQYPTPAARDEDDDVPDLVSPGCPTAPPSGPTSRIFSRPRTRTTARALISGAEAEK